MFKTLATAAALTLATLSAQAAPTPLAPLPIATAPAIEDTAGIEQTAYFCQWVTVYDYYGNWVTVWRCF